MSNKRRSYRGNVVDMDELLRAHGDSTTVGNMEVNARGDQIDEQGNVIKPRETLAREARKDYQRTSTTASVISAFEDDEDEDVALTDDPNVTKKSQTSTKTSSTTKSQSKTSSANSNKNDDDNSSTTDLD